MAKRAKRRTLADEMMDECVVTGGILSTRRELFKAYTAQGWSYAARDYWVFHPPAVDPDEAWRKGRCINKRPDSCWLDEDGKLCGVTGPYVIQRCLKIEPTA